jgi:hypothetical protein
MLRLILKTLVIAIMTVAAWPLIGWADGLESYPIGATFQTAFKLPNRTVPLPPGDWVLTAVNERKELTYSNVDFTLAKFSASGLQSYIYINTDGDTDSGNFRWIVSQDCERTDLLFKNKIYNIDGVQKCYWVSYRIFNKSSGNAPKFGKNIQDSVTARGFVMPSLMLSKTARLVNGRRKLHIEIYETVDQYGFPDDGKTAWADSPWHSSRFQEDQKKIEIVNKLRVEAENYYNQMTNIPGFQ